MKQLRKQPDFVLCPEFNFLADILCTAAKDVATEKAQGKLNSKSIADIFKNFMIIKKSSMHDISVAVKENDRIIVIVNVYHLYYIKLYGLCYIYT